MFTYFGSIPFELPARINYNRVTAT